jgi:uncharacterized protein (TIGR02145 family)
MKKINTNWIYSIMVIGVFLTLTYRCTKDEPSIENPETVTDIDGNVYKTVKIGTQIWMVENLKATRYNDGTPIPLITDIVGWKNALSPAYCWYDNNISNKEPYGALYNWYAVNTGKLCPTGWHVPTIDEWGTLEQFLGEENAPGGQLKEAGTSHWKSPNTGATNSTGFYGLPGGQRNPVSPDNGIFNLMGESGYFWSSSAATHNSSDGLHRALLHTSSNIGSGSNVKGNGYSVRCLKN